ncbi:MULTISPECIES: hypothetical protein [unclassified Chelatococcus]|uniref:hypothetical protein n=1 Tax=unclassified Chelatococcus TaxID=2638111 RepID=UPI001BCF9901|nr:MULTISPECIES: hypothetical protein [unclassified Chelatococcus]CAH1660375.1 conserved hypothetical protein [Hyphomicrobiales bacterium]MBS7741096.1 hypothetical protein [Chelatococcus sp. HY11]MBX3545282.1 hypothetical protein [Chelatococcus sp.]MCO5077915.1 hypothetical protein [Chelatococcus sp.]CAH1683462.1 conserved hypothetical protein [Hyphomicrobiales bacterium]
MSRSRNGQFLMAGVVTFVVLAVASFLVFDRLLVLPARDPPLSVRQVLFEQTTGPRIIIDAGSNAYVGLDPEILERRFGHQTVLLADHAGYPLDMKLSRLEKYLHQGDVLILPLEWNYYVGHFSDRTFTDNVFTALKHYYRALPFWERARFFFTGMKFSSVFKYVRSLVLGEVARPSSRAIVSEWYAQLKHSPFGAALNDGPVPRYVGFFDCRSMLLFGEKNGAPDLERLADRLAAIARARQVKIALTWPVVIGKDCYDAYERDFRPAENALRAAMGRVGIPILGNPRDYYFADERYMLDTYYHPIAEGARIRTRRLAEQVAEAGILASQAVSAAELAQQRLEAVDAAIAGVAYRGLVPASNGTHVIDQTAVENNMLFGRGWSQPEANSFIWSDGLESVLAIRLPERRCRLTLNHFLHGEQRDSEVRLVPSRTWQSASEPIEVPAAARGVALLQLRHWDVKSPLELGQGTDPRLLKFNLQSFTVDCEG